MIDSRTAENPMCVTENATTSVPRSDVVSMVGAATPQRGIAAPSAGVQSADLASIDARSTAKRANTERSENAMKVI